MFRLLWLVLALVLSGCLSHESPREPLDVATIATARHLKDLMDADIKIVSVNSRLPGEKPRLIFVQYWGVGNLAELASGVKNAFWEKELHQSQ